MKTKLILFTLVLLTGSLTLHASSPFSISIGLPAGNFGVEYAPDNFFIYGTMGGILPGLTGISTIAAGMGYGIELSGQWDLRPLIQYFMLYHGNLYESALPTPQYLSYDLGLGIELKYQFNPRWSVTLGLPVFGVHWDNRGLPVNFTTYYTDSIIVQALLSINLSLGR